MIRALYKISSAVLFVFLVTACGEKKPDAPNPALIPVPVNLYEVKPAKVVYYDKFPATIVAMSQVDIHAEVEGYVTGIFFKEGGHVTKGQKLYTIDDSKYQASFNTAQANVKVAESNLDQAQKDADRYTFLNEHDAVARQVLDHAMTTLKNAKDQVTAAKQEVTKAKTDLNYSVIRAPFDGIIGISQVKLGNTVIPGQTILNTISTDGPVTAEIAVNEKMIPRFIKLQQQKPNTADSTFSLLLPNNTLYNQVGQIYFIDRGVNPQTGTIAVRLSFPDPTTELRAGMSCTIRIRNDDTAMQMLIPGKAVVEQMGEYFVYVAKDTTMAAPAANSKDKPSADQHPVTAQRAAQKKVKLGQAIADSVIVRSGLVAGDKVIVDGVQKLHDGSILKVGGAPAQPGNGH